MSKEAANKMSKLKPTIQDMCNEIMNMGDVLACYAVNMEGKLLGANYGQIEVDDDLKKEFSGLAAGIWSGLNRVSGIGGRLKMVSAIFENFKILGLPLEGTNSALLLTVDAKLDSYILAERVNDFVSYWLKVNRYE